MRADEDEGGEKGGVSKVKLAIGAASLFLFIVGVKRTYKSEETSEPKPPRKRAPRTD